MVKYSKLDLTLQTTIKNDEILKYTGKLHLPLQTTFAFAEKGFHGINYCPALSGRVLLHGRLRFIKK